MASRGAITGLIPARVVSLIVSLISGITEKQVDNMEKSVLRSVTAGSDFNGVIKEVESEGKKGRAYAEFVARDQIGKAYGDINEERQGQAGFEEYEWVATDEPGRTRDSHWALNGTIQRWDKPPLVDGRNLHPGEDYQCRCVAVPRF